MKKSFTVVKYKTERQLVLFNNKPVNVRILKVRTSDPFFPSSLSVEDFDSDDPQPVYIKTPKELVETLQKLYGKKYVGMALQITKEPKVHGGKPNTYRIAELKIKK